MMGVLSDPQNDSRLVFCISMFQETPKKTNVLALPMPKNVSFEGKKLERVNRGQISEKILQNTKHAKKMRNLRSGQERKKQFFR